MTHTKTPLIFLHGFLGTPLDWDPVCKHLSSFPCIALNLPGHNHTPFTKNFTLPHFPKMHLIGYSMGGRLAMQYALQFPEKIASLTILSAHRGLEDPQEKQKRMEQDSVWAEKILKSFDDFLKQWYDQPLFGGFIPPLETRGAHNPKDLAKTLLHYSLGKQEVLDPKNVQFIVGERDEIYRNLYPHARVVSKAAHRVHLENPKEIARIIQEQVES